MNGLALLPLLAAFALVALVALAPLVPAVDRVVKRIALGVFGRYASRRKSKNPQQADLLEATHRGTTYRVYASKTFLYVALAATVGSVLTVYLAAALLVRFGAALQRGVGTLPLGLDAFEGTALTPTGVFFLFLASAATVGVVAGFATYQARWSLLRYRANERARRIDSTIQRNVAFMYALSRSGMAFSDILRILSRNRDVYGETADEIAVAVTDVDHFGANVIESLQRLARRTPSEELGEFAENLVSVLRSGRNTTDYLEQQYEYYKEEAESRQEQYLELLATLAEAYVTVFVAGPLFFITILVVVGLVLGGTLAFLRTFVYLLLPLATLGFVVYLGSLSEGPEVASSGEGEGPPSRSATRPSPVAAGATPGGVAADRRDANRARLAFYRALEPYRRWKRDPIEQIRHRPAAVLYLTLPIALVYVGSTAWSALHAGSLTARTLDDPIVFAVLFVTGTFAAIYALRRRWVDAVKRATPDLLDRFASVNEAGMSIVGSFERVANTDLGRLTPELRRTWRDIQWGAQVSRALARFERRVNALVVTRAVALVTNAMAASGNLGPVLRIAADEAKAARRLERERRNEMLTYLVVVYVAFFVFLTIVVALVIVFVPSIPTAAGTGGADALAGSRSRLGFGGATAAEKEAYTVLLFHAAIVQGICSGFVAGQMERNDVRAGAKHVVAMTAIAYAVLRIVGI